MSKQARLLARREMLRIKKDWFKEQWKMFQLQIDALEKQKNEVIGTMRKTDAELQDVAEQLSIFEIQGEPSAKE